MSTTQIKQKSDWPVVDAALKAMAEGSQLAPSTFAAIADRLRTAIEAQDAASVQVAAELLENFYRDAAAAASPSVQAASRGEAGGDLAESYALGKLAFAQLIAARIADTRADSRFVDHIRDNRYLPYVQAIFTEPLSVSAIREKVGTRLETVSRKLAVLRALGIVASRKQGNVVVNMLTPAAAATVEMLGLAPTREAVPVVKVPDVRQAIDKERETLKLHMQETPLFVRRSTTSRHKVA
ncbi:helix-turn-helix domain-containing protein [Mesorhizobium sp. M1050]|uniref:ArsR/SmtB family transcription factor n=1 Tax=Mesorhizobium sp. M1050 TaxID=2957051 RepID=UPI00333695C2